MSSEPATAAQTRGMEARDPTGPSKYYRARYYDSKLGRFISEEPIGLNAGVNFYPYVSNDPVSLADPLGTYTLCKGCKKPPLPLQGLLKIALTCLEGCLRERQVVPSIMITSTNEPGVAGHGPGTPHGEGLAADVNYVPNTTDQFMCCAAKCGFEAGLDEVRLPSKNRTGPHFHFQLVPGGPGWRTGPRGHLPPRGTCGCTAVEQPMRGPGPWWLPHPQNTNWPF